MKFKYRVKLPHGPGWITWPPNGTLFEDLLEAKRYVNAMVLNPHPITGQDYKIEHVLHDELIDRN